MNFYRDIEGIGKLHQDDIGVNLQMINAMVKYFGIGDAFLLLFLRRITFAENDGGILCEKSCQMALPIFPFIGGKVILVSDIIVSKLGNIERF